MGRRLGVVSRRYGLGSMRGDLGLVPGDDAARSETRRSPDLSSGVVDRSQRPRVSRDQAGGRTPSLDTYRRISELYGWPQTFVGAGVRLLLVVTPALATLSFLVLIACSSLPSEGSGSPFASGSAKGSVEGSDDFAVSQTIRYESGAIHGTLTYTGTCNLVEADVRFSYVKNGQTLTDKEGGGIRGYDIGPLAPNDPYEGNYPGEDKFTPDAIVFVISNERCA
jgi:hypothetical protein